MENEKLLSEIAAMFQEQSRAFEEYVGTVERRINLKIENDIGRRLDALAEGFAAMHDKVEDHEERITALEDRTA